MESIASRVDRVTGAAAHAASAGATRKTIISRLTVSGTMVAQDRCMSILAGVESGGEEEAVYSYAAFLSKHQASSRALQGALREMLMNCEPGLHSTAEGELDAETIEAVRLEVRAGVAEGLAPLGQLVNAMEKTMLKAIETGARLQRSRGPVR